VEGPDGPTDDKEAGIWLVVRSRRCTRHPLGLTGAQGDRGGLARTEASLCRQNTVERIMASPGSRAAQAPALEAHAWRRSLPLTWLRHDSRFSVRNNGVLFAPLRANA
jgi:hypothetical protein